MNLDDQKPILGVFFTYGVSLKVWKHQGMLQREITYYQRLAQQFATVYFFTYGKEDPAVMAMLREKGIVVKEKKVGIPNFFYSFLLPFLYKKELQECRVYKTNQMFGSWTGVLAKYLYKKKLLVRTGFTLSIFAKKKNLLKLFFAKMIEACALRACDACIVATEEEKNYFSKYKNKVVVIPNFVDTDIFHPGLIDHPQKEEKTILFVGRLTEQKNLENLLHALKGLSHISLQIIGAGELQSKLEQIVQTEQLDVHFLGNKPYSEIPAFIQKADVFVLPSLYEGNPKVLLEAMACGAPIVATRVPGIENIITHGENGYLCETDVHSIHQALQAVLIDVALQQSLGKNAAQCIQSEYSLSSIVKKEESLYNEFNIL